MHRSYRPRGGGHCAAGIRAELHLNAAYGVESFIGPRRGRRADGARRQLAYSAATLYGLIGLAGAVIVPLLVPGRFSEPPASSRPGPARKAIFRPAAEDAVVFARAEDRQDRSAAR